MKKVKLIPPDPKQCQVECKEGSFMTFGPRSYRRCEKTPLVIATLQKPEKDGQKGSMSMCAEHVIAYLLKVSDGKAGMVNLKVIPETTKRRVK